MTAILKTVLNRAKLIFSDVDETVADLYAPATEVMSDNLNLLIGEGKSLVFISGQGKQNIYQRVVRGINPSLRRHVLVCECSGAATWGFDQNGNYHSAPYYSEYDVFTDRQKQHWREIIDRLIHDFSLSVYPAMPLSEFLSSAPNSQNAIMVDDRGPQITFEVVHSQELRQDIFSRAKEMLDAVDLPVDVVLAGTYAIDFTIKGVTKATAVKAILRSPQILGDIGLSSCPRMDEMLVLGDKFSMVNGGTDMNFLYGLNDRVTAIDFRKEKREELHPGYTILVWDGARELHGGLEEYLRLYFETGANTTAANTGSVSTREKAARVSLRENRGYDIIFEDNLLDTNNTRLEETMPDDACVVFYDQLYDAQVGNRLRGDLQRYFARFDCLGIYPLLTSQNGCEKKDMALLCQALDTLGRSGLSRRGTVVGVGGGVLLDVVGLAAHLFRRSVNYIKIPTTLIGQVDAGIGIKVGVNYGGRKNLIGAFYPPLAVLIDMNFIFDLSESKIECGIAEMIKIAATSDRQLLEDMLHVPREGRLDGGALKSDPQIREDFREMIKRACMSTIGQLSLDFYEAASLRRLADFGHTFSSYIEEKSGYRISHGYAVAIDMLLSVYMAESLGLIAAEVRQRYVALFERYALVKREHLLFVRQNHADMYDVSIPSAIKHRGGDLNHVVPAGEWGNAVFLNLDNCRDRSDAYAMILSNEQLRHAYSSAVYRLLKDCDNRD